MNHQQVQIWQKYWSNALLACACEPSLALLRSVSDWASSWPCFDSNWALAFLFGTQGTTLHSSSVGNRRLFLTDVTIIKINKKFKKTRQNERVISSPWRFPAKKQFDWLNRKRKPELKQKRKTCKHNHWRPEVYSSLWRRGQRPHAASNPHNPR